MELTLSFQQAVLFAVDWGDLLKAVGPLLFIVFWVLSNLMEQGDKKRAQRPQRQPNARPKPAGQQGGEFRDEIEEFLRRGADQRGGRRPAQAAAAKPPADEARRKRRPAPERAVPAAQAAAAAAAAAAAIEAAESPRSAARVGESIAQHIKERFGDEELAQRAARLVSSLDRLDAERVRHQHQVFDHQLGTLVSSLERRAAEKPRPAPAPAVPADAIVAMLHNPEGVRQAIILNEILNRPVDRW